MRVSGFGRSPESFSEELRPGLSVNALPSSCTSTRGIHEEF